MAATLEQRRQAIAAALRAIMAEPYPDEALLAPTTVDAADVDGATALGATAPVDCADAEPADAEPDEIDSDVDDAASATDVEPRPVRVLHAVDHTPGDDTPHNNMPADDTEGDDTIVPPLESSGSFSTAASMALFGHA